MMDSRHNPINLGDRKTPPSPGDRAHLPGDPCLEGLTPDDLSAIYDRRGETATATPTEIIPPPARGPRTIRLGTLMGLVALAALVFAAWRLAAPLGMISAFVAVTATARAGRIAYRRRAGGWATDRTERILDFLDSTFLALGLALWAVASLVIAASVGLAVSGPTMFGLLITGTILLPAVAVGARCFLSTREPGSEGRGALKPRPPEPSGTPAGRPGR